MATLKEITNRVLKRHLREDEVSDITTDSYATLVAGFVADITEEVNETGPGWSFLNHTINVDLVDGTREYDLSATVANGGNVDNSDSPTTARSTLLHDPLGRPQAWLFDDATDTDAKICRYIDPNYLEHLFQMDRDLEQDDPLWFTIKFNAEKDGYDLVFYPTPSASRRFRIRFNTPEAVLDPDTDQDTEILVNNTVVRLGAAYLALNERGEELGMPGSLAERRYNNALAAEIEREIRVREREGYFDWRRG